MDPYLADGSLRKLEGFLEYDRDYFYLINMTNNRPDAECFCEWLLAQTKENVTPSPQVPNGRVRARKLW